MANGPLGGFMPTPAAPAQPPQVKLDTTADSRGNFNNFLRNMNGALSVNPPVMAPAMGAMTPNMAPPLSNIDIFDQPVKNFFLGGSAMSGGSFSDADIGSQIDSFDNNQQDNNQSNISDNNFDEGFTEEEDPERAGDYRTDDDNIFIEPGGSDLTSVPNVRFDNQAISDATQFLPAGNQAQREFKKDTIATLQDYAKDNDLAGALNFFQNEAVASGDKRGENIVNSIIQASNVDPAAYSVAVFNQPSSGILSLDDKNITDLAKTPDSLTDTGLRGSLTPGASQNVIDTAKNAIRASAGNNQAIDNIVAQFGSLDPSIGQLASRTKSGIGQIGQIKPGDVEDFSGTPTIRGGSTFGPDMDALRSEGALRDQVFDIDTTSIQPFSQSAGVQELLDRGRRAQETKDLLDRLDQDTIAENLDRDAPTGTVNRALETTSELDSEFGDEFPTVDPNYTEAPKVQALLNKTNLMPQATGFKVGETTIPSLASGINTLLSGATDMMNKRIYDGITKKGQTPVYDPVTGAITGSRDPRSGILMEGMDFADQDRATSDNEPTPIIRPLTPKPEEPKPELPPNVIGGTSGQIGNLQPITADTVVGSPFAPASSNIQPVTFDSGQLNRLIELLTGVPARPVVSAKKGGAIGMANGGLIKAVDDFLAAS
tara:strand:- start:438 stop:2405 length:1968 start_codon:yes stop_codon:yes gene_type:complete